MCSSFIVIGVLGGFGFGVFFWILKLSHFGHWEPSRLAPVSFWHDSITLECWLVFCKTSYSRLIFYILCPRPETSHLSQAACPAPFCGKKQNLASGSTLLLWCHWIIYLALSLACLTLCWLLLLDVTVYIIYFNSHLCGNHFAYLIFFPLSSFSHIFIVWMFYTIAYTWHLDTALPILFPPFI